MLQARLRKVHFSLELLLAVDGHLKPAELRGPSYADVVAEVANLDGRQLHDERLVLLVQEDLWKKRNSK